MLNEKQSGRGCDSPPPPPASKPWGVKSNELLSINVSPIENGSGHIVETGTVGQQVRLYYHQDLRGTVDYLTSPVSQKVESWTHYNEWGEITHNAVLKCGQRDLDLVKNYTGHDFDAVLNMYYAKARMYDAENRRFVALDPIMDGSKYDISERVTDPTMFVQYLYVNNMPLTLIDLLGEMGIIINDSSKIIDNPIPVGWEGEDYYSLEQISEVFGFDLIKSRGKHNLSGHFTINAVVPTNNGAPISRTVWYNAPIKRSGFGMSVHDETFANTTINGKNTLNGSKINICYYQGKPYISFSSLANLLGGENGYYVRFICSPTQYGDERYVMVVAMDNKGIYNGKTVGDFRNHRYYVYDDYQFVATLSYDNITYNEEMMTHIKNTGNRETEIDALFEAIVDEALKKSATKIGQEVLKYNFLSKELTASRALLSSLNNFLKRQTTPTAMAKGLYRRTFLVRKIYSSSMLEVTNVSIPYNYYILQINYTSPNMDNRTDIEYIQTKKLTTTPLYVDNY